jgi:uncharacterized membrane protein (UPF0127 family)
MRSGWLLRDGDVVCALDMADTWKERRQGLRARAKSEEAGAVHMAGVRNIHSAGLREAIDVAFLTEDLTVVKVTRLAPWRMTFGPRGVCSVLECEAGGLERWGVSVGDQLVIREVQ